MKRVRVINSVAATHLYAVDETVIVIDTLRATSLITTALGSGAIAIIPVVEITEAKDLKQKLNDPSILLAGERNALPIPGFDLGNTPQDCTQQAVGGKTLILTTSNGTRALHSLPKAKVKYIASLLNVNSTVDLFRSNDQLTILCAGTHDLPDMSDSLTAGAIIAKARTIYPNIEVDDYGLLCETSFSIKTYKDLITNSWHGQNMQRLGLQEDLDYCLQINLFNILPYFDGYRIIV